MLETLNLTGGKSFEESAHPSEYGSIDMYEVISAMKDFNTLVQFALTTEE